MKLHFYFLASLFCLNFLNADCCSTDDECSPICNEVRTPTFIQNLPVYCEKLWTLDFRVAYYAPQSKKLRKVYSGSWMDVEVELSRSISNNIDVWAGFSWAIQGHGKKHCEFYGFKKQTSASILPLSLGLKWTYSILPCADIYFGAGVCYTFFTIHNRLKELGYSYYEASWSNSFLPYKDHYYKGAWGGIVKFGMHYDLSRIVFVDFFADYFYQKFHFSRHRNSFYYFDRYLHGEINLSGIKTGIGLGVYF